MRDYTFINRINRLSLYLRDATSADAALPPLRRAYEHFRAYFMLARPII